MVTHEVESKTMRANPENHGDLLNELRTGILRRIELIEDTIPTDDRGRLDYHLVKEHHNDVRESKKTMTEYKRAITVRLLQGAIGLILTILGFGLGPYFGKIFGG